MIVGVGDEQGAIRVQSDASRLTKTPALPLTVGMSAWSCSITSECRHDDDLGHDRALELDLCFQTPDAVVAKVCEERNVAPHCDSARLTEPRINSNAVCIPPLSVTCKRAYNAAARAVADAVIVSVCKVNSVHVDRYSARPVESGLLKRNAVGVNITLIRTPYVFRSPLCRSHP
jgi:hypothetical protein